MFKHPWSSYLPKTSALSVEKIMSMSDGEIASLMSEKATFAYCNCPNCHGGIPINGSLNVWAIDDPFHIKCGYCGMRFPNEKYPENKEMKVINPLGATQTYRYHEDENGWLDFFTDTARHYLKMYLAKGAYELGVLYNLTNDHRYAHKAAVILKRFAEVYPSIPIRDSWARFLRRQVFYSGSSFPYASGKHASGKWDYWIYNDIPVDCALAYDLIYNSGELEKLGPDVKRMIEDDFLRASVELAKGWLIINNAAPQLMRGMIVVGRTIGEPEYVHEAVDMFRKILQKGFFYDGMWCEGTLGYHFAVVRGLEDVMNVAEGYTDQPGYKSLRDGSHFENLNLRTLVPFLEKIYKAPKQLYFPNGTYVPIHDTRGGLALSPHDRIELPIKASEPKLLPGLGHAILFRGEGDNQIQAHLHYCFLYSHGHSDCLNLILYAKGKELLSDYGYTHSALRSWATCSLGHNTVLIDEKCQHIKGKDRHSFGNLMLFEANHPNFQIVEARGERSYNLYVEDLDLYMRTLVMVEVYEEDAYIIDIFRARGGALHDWAAHGSANEEQDLECSLRLEPKLGTLRGPDTKYSDIEKMGTPFPQSMDRDSMYGLVDNLRSATTKDTWTCEWRCKDSSEVGLRLTMLGGPERKVVIGQCPSVRAIQGDNRLVDAYKMPILVVREKNKETVNVAVWEPYKGGPFITKVEPLRFKDKDAMAVGIAVTIGQRTDYLLTTLDEPPYKFRAVEGHDNLYIRGRFGIISEIGGKVKSMYLVDGVELAKGAYRLKGSGPLTGKILAVNRKAAGAQSDSFEMDTLLPIDGSLNNKVLVVTHSDGTTHGYTIQKVEWKDERSIIHLQEDPGFEIELEGAGSAGTKTVNTVSKFVFFPESTFKGEPNKFKICNAERLEF